MVILGILLAVSVAGNGLLSKLYVGAKADVARAEQALKSFVTEQKALGEEAANRAAAQKMADKLAKDTADAENAATRLADKRTIERLRADADRTRGGFVPPAPAGSKCPPDQACFDAAGIELALRGRREEIRGLADESTQVEIDLATARKWAQGGR